MNNIYVAQQFSTRVLEDLRRQGYAFFRLEAGNTDSLCHQLLDIALKLGTPLPTRSKAFVDRLVPHEKEQAYQKSLSALTGPGIQPWHIDLAHLLTPARYIILACEREGSNQVSTELTCWENLSDATDQEAACSEPFLVRNGANSFYSTILTHSQQYLRFDPGCMQPVTTGAKALMNKICRANVHPTLQIHWKSEHAVVIDNWRMLHRRLDAHKAKDRVLLRVSVTGDNRR